MFITAQLCSKPVSSKRSTVAFSLTVRTLVSSKPPIARAVTSTRTSSSTPVTAARWAMTSWASLEKSPAYRSGSRVFTP